VFNPSKSHKNDPVFGSMIFIPAKLGDYWEGTVHFAPTDCDIEVFVDGATDEDLSDQRGLYLQIMANWSVLSPKIRNGLQEHFPELSRDLTVSGLNIPKAASFDNANWEVYFESPSSQYSYTVAMTGAKVIGVSRDC
jgi:hypothetical protein